MLKVSSCIQNGSFLENCHALNTKVTKPTGRYTLYSTYMFVYGLPLAVIVKRREVYYVPVCTPISTAESIPHLMTFNNNEWCACTTIISYFLLTLNSEFSSVTKVILT